VVVVFGGGFVERRILERRIRRTEDPSNGETKEKATVNLQLVKILVNNCFCVSLLLSSLSLSSVSLSLSLSKPIPLEISLSLWFSLSLHNFNTPLLALHLVCFKRFHPLNNNFDVTIW
jgi:hypothetical protein